MHLECIVVIKVHLKKKTVFLSHFGAFLESSLIFTKKYVHFSKQFIQTAPQNGLPAKACNLFKSFSSFLKSISNYVNEHISALRVKSPCVIVRKQYSQNA